MTAPLLSPAIESCPASEAVNFHLSSSPNARATSAALRIFSWAGRVCVGADHAGARLAFGIPSSIKATIYDLTDGLRDLAEEVLGRGHWTGAGAMDSDPTTTIAELQATLEAVLRQLTEVAQDNADKAIEIETLHTSLSARQLEVDQLRELVKLYEDAAEQAERNAEQAQAMAAWEAQQKTLSAERRQRVVTPVTIIQDPLSDVPLSETSASAESPPPSPAGADTLLYLSHAEAVSLQAPAAACEAPPSPVLDAPETGRAIKPSREQVEDTIRAGFVAGDGWDVIAKAVTALGRRMTSHAARMRAQKMGLRKGDRQVQLPRGPKSPAGQRIVQAAKLPAVAAPAAGPPVRSRLVAMWGEKIQSFDNQGYDPDEIADLLNAVPSKNGDISGKQVRQIQQELKRLKRDGGKND